MVLSQYGGKGPEVPYKLEGSTSINRVTTVTGAGTDAVVLVLTAYQSTIWDLSRIAGRVKAVYATGLNPQGVVGLNKDVPVRFSHGGSPGQRYGSGWPCPVIHYIGDGSEIQNGAKTIESMFGRWPSDLHESYSTPTFSIDGGPLTDLPTRPPISSVKAGVRVDARSLPNGEAGLRRMVDQNLLAPANQGDIVNWERQGGRLSAEGRMAAILSGAGRPPRPMGDIFLVTRSIDQIPEGLDGAHLVTFILPAGVRAPVDTGSHSQFLRLTGMRGVPQTSGGTRSPGAGFDDFALRRLAPGYQPHHVQWTRNGNLLSETLVINDNDPTHSGSGHQSVRDFLAGRSKTPYPGGAGSAEMPMAETSSTPRPNGYAYRPAAWMTSTSDMTPTAVVASLLFSLGAAGLVLNRRRTGRPSYPFASSDAPPAEGASREASGRTRTPEQDRPEPGRMAIGMAAMSSSLQEAIDLSGDDETALTLLKFKRTIMRVLRNPDYDEDIADELDAIVERHMTETVTIYIRAARRTGAVRSETVETNLRQSVQRLTDRIEELAASQSRRDSDRLRERSDFIHARHPGDTDVGGSR